MASLNQVTICGNVTRDIELRTTPGGTSVCEVGVAINDKYKSKDGQYVDKVVFVDVACFGRTADLAAEYLRKGSQVLFQAKLSMSERKDRDTGKARSKLGLTCENMQFLGGKGDGGESRRPAPTQDRAPDFNPNDAFPVGTDEVPF